MPRGRTQREKESEDEAQNLFPDEAPSVDPYAVLGLDTDATDEAVKKAYRKLALLHHPDKVPDADKTEANKKFQELALAYAVLSDPKRRKRYDLTGSTSETIQGDEDFDWLSFYREQFEDVVNEENIERIAKEYKGSDQERQDILDAYTMYKGKFAGIYATVMLSDIMEDDERFREIINDAIEKGDVESYPAWARESTDAAREKAKTAEQARREAWEKKHGSTKEAAGKAKAASSGGRSKKRTDAEEYDNMGDLAALIQQRQKGRMSGGADFFANLEAKYAPRAKGKKRSVPMDEPTEEEFQAVKNRLSGRAAQRSSKKKVALEDDDDEDGDDAFESEGVDDRDTDEEEEEEEEAPPPVKRARRAKNGAGKRRAKA